MLAYLQSFWICHTPVIIRRRHWFVTDQPTSPQYTSCLSVLWNSTCNPGRKAVTRFTEITTQEPGRLHAFFFFFSFLICPSFWRGSIISVVTAGSRGAQKILELNRDIKTGLRLLISDEKKKNRCLRSLQINCCVNERNETWSKYGEGVFPCEHSLGLLEGFYDGGTHPS